MQILARGTKQLSSQVADPAQQKSTIALLETLKKTSQKAQSLTPRKASMIPQGEKEKFLKEYSAQIGQLTDTFNQIEEAVNASQYDKAKSLLPALNSLKKEGHRKFKAD